MCGIFGIINHKEAARLTYLGLYALQHRGEESAGIVTHTGKKVLYRKGMGLSSDVFPENSLKTLKGSLAVGHVRYSTTGSSVSMNIQPFYVNHRKGPIVIAHNGNLTNTVVLRDEMEGRGSIFQTSMDSEIIAHLIARSGGENILKDISHALAQLQGAYSVVLMIGQTLIGARDPHGFRPLCIGKLDDAFILASETCALDLIHAEYIRDVEPGEIVMISDNKLESYKPFTQCCHSFCIFEYIYFSRPDSNIFCNNVYLTRKRLGQQLAQECPVKCDIVVPIPDSGSYAGVGFAEVSGIPLEMGVIRNHYVGRTFIQPSQFVRDFRVRVKLNPIADVLKGKRVVLIEDSIVRGTTSRARVKTVRAAGAREVHMRVSCPPLKFPCYYGIDFPTKKELIASKHTIAWIKDFIGVDSLMYLSLDGMLKAMPLAAGEFCTACFTGKYPTKVPTRMQKNSLEKRG